MIEKLYSDFDSDITIRSNLGKTFPESQVEYESLKKIEGIINTSRAVEEVVVIKNENKTINATLVGVDTSFLTMTNMSAHLLEKDKAFIQKDGRNFGIIGASLLEKLGGYIPERAGYENVQIYVPKRDSKVRLGSNPFNVSRQDLSGRMNFNREVNAEKLVLPLEISRELLNYNQDLTAIYIDVDPNYSNESVKEIIKERIGKDFDVKTNYEKNELIYKTSKSEKLIVLIILLFIFILAAFNLIASLTMLFVEKKDNILTMIGFGANYRTIFNIFFLEGLLISGKGIVVGIILGYGVCLLQLNFPMLTMPNSGGEPFPIGLSFVDGILIIFLVSALSFLFSYLPVRFLIKKNFGHLRF